MYLIKVVTYLKRLNIVTFLKRITFVNFWDHIRLHWINWITIGSKTLATKNCQIFPEDKSSQLFKIQIGSNQIKMDQTSHHNLQKKGFLAPMCRGCMVGMAKARNTQFFAAKIACAFESTRKQQNFALYFGCSFLLPLALLAVRPKLPILTVLSSQSHYI